MDAATIILLVIIFVGVLIVVSLTFSLYFETTRKRKAELKRLNSMRREIQFLADLHMEDDRLNELRRKYPDLTEVIESYKEARNDYFGVERIGKGTGTEDRDN